MFTGTLKPYQVEAVNAMVAQRKMLVAYEMGLGKTPMTIAAIEELRVKGDLTKPTLVFCLSSLKYQWQKEVTKFSDSTAIVIDGTKAKRQEQYAEAEKYDYIIINYDLLIHDWTQIAALSYQAMVCDEATAIKGFRAKRSKRVKDLAHSAKIRYALTGTPIENGRPEELFSIMEFVNRTILGRFDLFDKTFLVRNQFGGIVRYRNLPTFHKVLAEHSVRKSQKDDDVAPYLPDAVYREPVVVKLDREAQKIYTQVANSLLEMLIELQNDWGRAFSLEWAYGKEWAENPKMSKIMTRTMQCIQVLRMLSNTPKVLQQSYRDYEESEGKFGSEYIHEVLGSAVFDLYKQPKLDAVVDYVKEHLDIDPTYKAVIFSNYKAGVREIVRVLETKGIKAVPYTGAMNAKVKETAKTQFQTDPETRALVSSDAGGYGVDLPQANLLCNFDLPYTAGMAAQRNARINRTASTWPTITIQDFLVADSIEERQYAKLKQKMSVAMAILDGKGINSKGGIDLTVGSLIEFLTGKVIDSEGKEWLEH